MGAEGVYLHREGQHYNFLRIHADGELYMVAVGSPSPYAKVLSDVMQWFHRDYALPARIERARYRTEGGILSWRMRRFDGHELSYDGRNNPDRSISLTCHDTTTGGRHFVHLLFLAEDIDWVPAMIDLNAADAADLEILIDVGPALARRIVSDRDQHGPFPSVDALVRVKGIGAKKLVAFRRFCKV